MTLDSPYKGLESFGDSEMDALLFFGRERECEIVVANLIASRLTVLYGPAGVGKSSLLRAAVARALRELPEAPLVVVFDRWSDDPSSALAGVVAEACGRDDAGDLVEEVERAQQERDVYLILDQAEEYFVYHADEAPLDAELARLIAAPLRVNVLLSVREDSLARLDRFKPRIPGVYGNSLRLDRLDRRAARAAIVGPVGRWNEMHGEDVHVEPALVEAVLDGVGAGQIEPGMTADEPIEGNGRPDAVEAPYLQLVMERLWEVERLDGSTNLRAETLAALGGARQVVADHLNRAVGALDLRERDIAAQLFTYLVTPSGTKIAHELPDLAEYAGVSAEDADQVVSTLSRHRILRPDEAGRTEIFHDVLAAEVLAWRRAHNAERALELERADSRRRHRRLAWLAGFSLGAFLLMAALTVFALTQRSQARDQAREAKAHELEARASTIVRDPELSLLLAREAASLAPTESAEEALRNALLASRVRGIVRLDRPLAGAAVSGSDVIAATTAGPVVVAEGRRGRPLRTVANARETSHASFADDGTVLLTGRDGRVRLVQPSGDVAELPGIEGARNAVISDDGSRAVVVVKPGALLVELPSGTILRRFPHRGARSAAITFDRRRIATGAADDTVRIWRTGSGRLVRSLEGQQGHPEALAFSPNGRLLASGSTDGIARIWPVLDQGAVITVPGDATALTAIGFSTDGEHVVTASKDGTVRVAKADTGAPLFVLNGHDDRVTTASFTGPVGSPVVTASADGTARIWDALFQPKARDVASLNGPVTSVEMVRDDIARADTRTRTLAFDVAAGRRVDTGPLPPVAVRRPRRVVGPDGTTALIRGRTVVLTKDGETAILRGHRDRVLAVAFSPDGKTLASAGRDRDVWLWNVDTGEKIRLLSHNSAVRDVAFSPNGRWLITAASRATMWDPTTGTPVVRIVVGPGYTTSVAFDPSSRIVLTGGSDGTVGTYVCTVCGSLSELLDLANHRLERTGRTLTPAERERYLG